MPGEGFRAAGKTIIASNRNRLASKIEADRCDQRTNMIASDTEGCRCADVGNYTLRAGTTQSSANVKFPAVTCVSTETARQMTLLLFTKRPVKRTIGTEVEVTFRTPGARKAAECPPEICRRGRAQNKKPKHDRICSRLGH